MNAPTHKLWCKSLTAFRTACDCDCQASTTPASQVELLPCPFCGSREIREGSSAHYCVLCGASAATTAWNRRSPTERWPDFIAPPKYENPAEGWEDPRLPDFRKIWEAARTVGYAVGLHGSMKRDCDLIAVPWTDLADTPDALIQAICSALPARQLGGVEQKPHGRIAVTLQVDAYVKPIDLSIFARTGADALSRLTAQTPQPASPTPAASPAGVDGKYNKLMDDMDVLSRWLINGNHDMQLPDGLSDPADVRATLTALEGERDRLNTDVEILRNAANRWMGVFEEERRIREAAEQSLTAERESVSAWRAAFEDALRKLESEREKNGRMEGAINSLTENQYERDAAAKIRASIAKPAEHKEPQG